MQYKHLCYISKQMLAKAWSDAGKDIRSVQTFIENFQTFIYYIK